MSSRVEVLNRLTTFTPLLTTYHMSKL